MRVAMDWREPLDDQLLRVELDTACERKRGERQEEFLYGFRSHGNFLL
jgi:hypothetical protein